jgi:hypothetical protein
MNSNCQGSLNAIKLIANLRQLRNPLFQNPETWLQCQKTQLVMWILNELEKLLQNVKISAKDSLGY